jgi:ribose transport system substrate-binding protein
MLKHLLMAGVAGALVLGGALATASVSHAQDKKLTFAVVPKALNNPFYDQAKAGCEKAAA